MKKIVCLVIYLFSGILNAAPVTIDFNTINSASLYSEDGFSFSATGNHTDSSNYLYWHDGGANPGDNDIILSFGGAAFDIISFDALQIGSLFSITGSNGNVFSLASGSSLGNYAVNLLNITSAKFETSSSTRLDNLVLNTTPSSVPEPASFVLLGLGLAGIGFSRKKPVRRNRRLMIWTPLPSTVS